MKKIFATVLALLMCFLSVNVTAFAAGNEITVDLSDLLSSADSATALPDGDVNSSSLSVDVSDTEDVLLFSYTTTAAGDYCFNFTDLHAYVSVFSVDGEQATCVYESVDSEYIAESGWEMRDCLIFHLKADTTYYFAVAGYTASTTKLSITQAGKTVQKFVPTKVLYRVNSAWTVEDLDGQCFGYKITFADYATKEGNSAELEKIGYVLPEITYTGKTIQLHDSSFLAQGSQPIVSVYNGVSTVGYITVKSFIGWLSGEGIATVGEEQPCLVMYVDNQARNNWWRVRVSKNGFFGIHTAAEDTFTANLAHLSVEIVDQNDNVVPYNDTVGGWPLAANQEYVLSFQYCYNEDYTGDGVQFWLEKEADMQHGWVSRGGKWYYYENDVMVKNAWRRDSKGWVKLGADGTMLTNQWTTDSKGWCYVGADGYAVTNCWKKDSKGWLYLDANGSMVKNQWITDNGHKYYCGADGYMCAGRTVSVKDDHPLSIDPFYFFGMDGTLVRSDFLFFTGWAKDTKGWMWVEYGTAVKSKWIKDGGEWYYCGADGYMVAGKNFTVSGKKYFFGLDGTLVREGSYLSNCWAKDTKGWMWVNANGSAVKAKWVKDGGKWYYIDANGYMVTNKWMKDSKGWVKLGDDGAMLTNKWTTDSKGWCYVGADGYAATNCWRKDSRGWVWLDENGSMTKSEWVYDGGYWYYCDANGYMVANKSLRFGNKTYRFNTSGICVNR